jgi:argininosuccinate lyase
MKNSVTDELVNKMYHLTKALDIAKGVIDTLQVENDKLKTLLEDINSNQSHDYAGVA